MPFEKKKKLRKFRFYCTQWFEVEGMLDNPNLMECLTKGAFLWENPNPDSCIQKRILRFFT